MEILIRKDKEYSKENPKTIVECIQINKKVIFDKDVTSEKISKFLFSLLEVNENEKVHLIFDENANKDDKFINYVKDLFSEFIESWNDSIFKK